MLSATLVMWRSKWQMTSGAGMADDACFERCTEVLLQVMRKGQDRANKLSAREYTT